MKTKRMFLTTLFALSCFWASAQYDRVMSNTSRDLYYDFIKSDVDTSDIMILLPGWGESTDQVRATSEIVKQGSRSYHIAIINTQADSTFYIDKKSMDYIDYVVSQLYKERKFASKIVLGGFSLGGTAVAKYLIDYESSRSTKMISSYFLIDPILDFQRLSSCCERLSIRGGARVSVSECSYINQKLNIIFNGQYNTNKRDSIDKQISIVTRNDNPQKFLKIVDTKLIIFTEIDPVWMVENRNKDLYDLNAMDCVAFFNNLKLIGNNNAELIVTKDKGYKNGNRNPHSWSIVDYNILQKYLSEN